MLDSEKKILLSVIVPCYNVERFLDRSLACLSRQWKGRNDYEIILVNDASTDNTIEKLNEFKSQFTENVIVIDRKENGGLGIARNTGLEVARGEWIVFFDSDDALVDNGYGSLLELTSTTDADIISFGVSTISDKEWDDKLMKEDIGQLQIDWSGTGQEHILRGFTGVCWRYFFKRELVADRRFRKVMLLEDVFYDLPIFLSDVKVASTETVVYYYMLREASLTTLIEPKKMNRACDDILAVIQFLDQHKEGKTDAIKKWIEDRQLFYKNNLASRLILSDKGLADLKKNREAIKELSITSSLSKGRERLYDLAIAHPCLILLIRPLYRAYRRRQNRRLFH